MRAAACLQGGECERQNEQCLLQTSERAAPAARRRSATILPQCSTATGTSAVVLVHRCHLVAAPRLHGTGMLLGNGIGATGRLANRLVGSLPTEELQLQCAFRHAEFVDFLSLKRHAPGRRVRQAGWRTGWWARCPEKSQSCAPGRAARQSQAILNRRAASGQSWRVAWSAAAAAAPMNCRRRTRRASRS